MVEIIVESYQFRNNLQTNNMKCVSKHSKEFELEKEDIQGLLARGYQKLNAARYILLKITDVKLAKKYFQELIHQNYITTADVVGNKFPDSNDPETAVQIAFTSTGLCQLLPDKNIIKTFSREFIEGMCTSNNSPNEPVTERSALLGDTRNNNPKYWYWGNKDHRVDCVLMLYAENNEALVNLIANVYTSKAKGLSTPYPQGETFEYDPHISKEHFGFRDGIAQPFIKGMSRYEDDEDEHNVINAGEFILGYKNEYDNYSPSPYVEADKRSIEFDKSPIFKDKKDLGKNGSYLVFRQIEQHVDTFWQFHYDNSKEAAPSHTGRAVKLASKMIGRWPDGQPLVTCPEGGCPMDEAALDKFSYFKVDKDGVKCPLGAHIRRTNPRDQVHTIPHCDVATEMVKKHRMLRRGRIYGTPIDKKFDVDTILDEVKNKERVKKREGKTELKRGLHFICLVSDIARQFEFVQNVWANTSTFGNLCNEVDPVISPRPTDDQPHCHEFTTPQDIVRNRYTRVPEFTTVVGGAYFFMPGIKALKYIVRS